MSASMWSKTAHLVTAAPRCALAESPRWSGEGWWWVDVEVGDIWNLSWPSAADDHQVASRMFSLGGRVSFVQPLQSSKLLIADGTDIVTRDLLNPGSRKRASVPVVPGEVLNDGAVHIDGRLFIGSVGPNRRDDGWLWSVGIAGDVTRVAGPFCMSNGMAWVGPDVLLHADSGTRTIWAHSFLAGSLARSEVFTRFAEHEGMPDGICSDGVGGVWVAMYGAGVVRHFDSAGNRLESIEVGTPQVTSVVLGGADGRTLLITTASEGLVSDSALGQLAGRLFQVQLE